MFRTIGLGVLLGVLGFSPVMASSTLDMRGVLEQRVRIYQAAKDCKAMAALFYTDGINKARRKAFSKTVEDFVCVNFDRTIASIAFQTVDPAKQQQPADFGEKRSAFTLTPQGAIVIDYGKGAPAQPKSLSFLYGEHDGKDYLITTKNADTK